MNRRHVRSRLRGFELPLSFDDCPAGGKVSAFLRTALSTFVGASLLASGCQTSLRAGSGQPPSTTPQVNATLYDRT
ncbi:hypothetical protein C4K32_5602 [Pseudomonas chlororaphis subsp. piscium]|nr:hypothetical protein C4K32_5602 [Pseudomonas chlororaphis subsp. piscium]AZC84812.1 hypothetical protein C4K30_5733 [Pseudomonas chlororaphis subsp. piscium]